MFGFMALSQASVAGELGGITGKVSTLGVGLEYTRPLNKYFTARFGINGFDYDKTIDESGVNYDATLELRSGSAIADYHPWAAVFRISGGVLYNGNKFTIKAKPSNGTLDFNGTTYNAADVSSASGKIDFQPISPYIGIGWGSSPTSNSTWSFEADIGAIYQGTPDASLSVVCGGTLNAAQCAQLKNDVAAERVQLQDTISDFKWYPVVSVGVSYKF